PLPDCRGGLPHSNRSDATWNYLSLNIAARSAHAGGVNSLLAEDTSRSSRIRSTSQPGRRWRPSPVARSFPATHTDRLPGWSPATRNLTSARVFNDRRRDEVELTETGTSSRRGNPYRHAEDQG